MKGRFRPFYLANEYDKKVVAKGKCILDAPPNEYVPLFNCVTFPSYGFRTMFGSWIVDRPLQFMSSTELHAGIVFHAPDSRVVNISEQVGLDPAITRAIASRYEIKHPSIHGNDIIMSTDMVVTFSRDGGLFERQAYAVKQQKDLTKRVLQKLAIEYEYWRQKGIKLYLILDTQLCRQLISNMELLMEFTEAERLPCSLDEAAVTLPVVFTKLQTGLQLREACLQSDETLSMPFGTSLAVAYHGILRGLLPFDLRSAHLPTAKLSSDFCKEVA